MEGSGLVSGRGGRPCVRRFYGDYGSSSSSCRQRFALFRGGVQHVRSTASPHLQVELAPDASTFPQEYLSTVLAVFFDGAVEVHWRNSKVLKYYIL